MFKRLLLSASLVLASTALIAASFEGVATYKVLGKEGKDGPKELSFSIKGDKFRTDMDHNGHQASMIMNNKTKEMITLMPERRAYMLMKMDGRLAKGDKAKHAAKLVKTGKTETIAGYKAEEWSIEGAEHKTSVWGTKELGGWAFNGGPKGHGADMDLPDELKDGSFFMLRVVGEKGGGMEATKVEKKSLDDSLFEVPAGYQKMEMGAMMGGGEGHGMGAGMTDEQKKRMFEKMKNMTPEQRAMMEKMFKGKGGD
jgi:hypothetical protein